MEDRTRDKKDPDDGPSGRFTALFNNSPDVMIVTAVDTGDILSANPAMSHVLGRDPGSVLAKHYSVLFPGEGDRSRQERLDDLRVYGPVFEAQPVTKADRSVIPMDLTATLIPWERGNAFLITLRDVTDRERGREALRKAHEELEQRVEERTTELRVANERLQEEIRERKRIEVELRKAHDELEIRVMERTADLSKAYELLQVEVFGRSQAQRALTESEKRYRAVVEDQTELICRFLPGGKLTFVNGVFCRYIGQLEEDLLERGFFRSGLAEGVSDADWELWPATPSNPLRTYEQQWNRPQDGARWLLWNERAIFDPDLNVVEFQAVGRDVTELKKTEFLLLRGQRSRAVADLTTVAGHNFNNLLQIVIGGTHLAMTNLELGHLDLIRDTLEEIRRSAFLGAETVKRLYYLAGVQTESKSGEEKPFDLSKTVHLAVEISRPWWKTGPEREGISVNLIRDLGPNCFVRGKDDELFEVTINLIKNAVEALLYGGRIQVTTFSEDKHAVLVVQDDGVGIPGSMTDRIFEPFWTTKGPLSAGMGLPSCRSIVTRHNGMIEVVSEEGKGSVFTVRLPRLESLEEPAIADAFETLMPLLKLLVVDDLEPIVRMLRDALQVSGQKVYAAMSGRKALEIFKAAPCDAVICDLAMPEMNGWEVAKQIKAICEDRGMVRPPFLLLTGWAGQPFDEDRLADAGIDKVVGKPIDVRNLLRTIRSLVWKAKGAPTFDRSDR
ncbi:MAG: PAS domain S-box protein [Pseudomonadota bacterium]